MKSSSKLVWIRLNFRVNDLEFRQGLMRPSERDATDFQILIEDRFLGSFALHDDLISNCGIARVSTIGGRSRWKN